jgi:adenylosuccinate synthase
VVLDVQRFFEEYEGLAARGVQLSGRVGVSQRAHLILPFHRALDCAAESEADEKIGTTGRGIGPAYEQKAGRRGIRVADLAHPERVGKLLAESFAGARGRLGLDEAGAERLRVEVDRALESAGRLQEMATDTGLEIGDALARGKRVLLEGAQGTALDLDHGTYPFVTSSNTTAAAAATGVGVGPTAIGAVVGVVKAYTTRVGNGPLPTGFDPEMDERVRRLGGEFGATTGRPRRCGWFDAVLARYAARVNGLTSLAVTKLDVLDSLPELSIAVEYRTEVGNIREFPADTWLLGKAGPVYEKHPGWSTPTTAARRLEDLPRNARAYLDRIQELTGAPIEMVSVGTRRNQIIHVG